MRWMWNHCVRGPVTGVLFGLCFWFVLVGAALVFSYKSGWPFLLLAPIWIPLSLVLIPILCSAGVIKGFLGGENVLTISSGGWRY